MEIVVPDLGESIVEATVARWLKKEGDPVSVGEPVVALETDKVDLEVGAKQDGVLVRILHAEGEDVQVGQVLGEIGPSGTGGDSDQAPSKQVEEEEQEGADSEEQAAPDKTAAEPVTEQQPARAEAASEQQAPVKEARSGDGSLDRVTPVARRLAESEGVDLSKVAASGPGARVTKEDVERFLSSKAQTGVKPAVASEKPGQTAEQPVKAQPQPAKAQPEPSRGRREERVRMTRRRRTIAARLVEAQHTAAMLTTFNDIDMSEVVELRSRWKEPFQKKHDIKLGFMSFFVKAVIGALKEFPELNAEIDQDEIVYKHYYDIGMAIGSEEGLVVPVLRDADRMTFAEIEKAISALVEKTQNGQLSLEDLRGGTFTITNGGVFGSLLSTPILNPPQVAILGLHRIEERPIARDGQVVIRPMMYAALSYDHRLVDGREAVQFLVRVKEMIEDPETLLLEG